MRPKKRIKSDFWREKLKHTASEKIKKFSVFIFILKVLLNLRSFTEHFHESRWVNADASERVCLLAPGLRMSTEGALLSLQDCMAG